MRYCLINLTRLGDLLQTQTVIHALRQQGHEVGLICLENFAQAVQLLQGLNYWAALPGALLLRELHQDWRQSLGQLQAWVEQQKQSFAPDLVLNFTPSISARLLANLLGQGQSIGFAVDRHGFGADSSMWASYVQAASKRRGASPFNLVDGFRKMAGVGEIEPVYSLQKPDQDALTKQGQILEEQAARKGLRTEGGFTAFQLGASESRRQWPAHHFARLGKELQEAHGICPVLVGSAQERDLAAAYLTEGPAVDLTGQTDLPALAAVLCNSRLLVTNDTGTMHLAAGLGTPCLAIFLATAQAWDTGPYAVGNCCLEPDLPCHPCNFDHQCTENENCRRQISPDLVCAIVRSWLQNGQWSAVAQADQQARIWLTSHDRNGFMSLEPLSATAGTDRTVWIQHQRRFYSRLLDDLDGNPASTTGVWTGRAAMSPGKAGQIQKTLSGAIALLLLIRERAKMLGLRNDQAGRTAFLSSCERLTSLLREDPDFVPLFYLWQDALQGLADDWNKLVDFFDKLRGHLQALHEEINACQGLAQ